MDTVRLRFEYDKSLIRPEHGSLHFGESIPAKSMETMLGHTGGSRHVLTSHAWRNAEKSKGRYMPKYWIENGYTKPDKTYFVIEVSLPKLVYGTNIISLTERDGYLVAMRIHQFCQEVGVYIEPSQILNTVPMAVAFGKNIDITNFTTPELAINILAPFNDRFRSKWLVRDFDGGGRELYFNTSSSTFKVYDKLAELKNNAVTAKEKSILDSTKAIGTNGETWVGAVLRAELTLKTATALRRRTSNFLKKEPTLGNLFNSTLWDTLLSKEVKEIFDHPLADFVFLASLQNNVIEHLLYKYTHTHQQRIWVKSFIEAVQNGGGTRGIRRHYDEHYHSRQTFHNHQKIAQFIVSKLDPKLLEPLSSRKFHAYFLSCFDLTITHQPNTLF